MKVALQIFSWIAVILGTIGVFGLIGEEDAMYGLLVAALWITNGVLALIYISKE